MPQYENGMSCLEKRGREQREKLLLKNKWAHNYYEYTKGLVDEEYNLSNEYPLAKEQNL